MTSEELVKSMLEADTCELYDKTRINNLFKNFAQGHGKLAIVDENTISITHNINKTKKLTYLVPKVLLTDEQLSQI